MLFTVIVPVYNLSGYIEETINAILVSRLKCQSRTEIILIDDGSTDRTYSCIAKYKELQDVRIFRKNHKGLGAARNFGIKEAKGEYILYVDGDDLIEESTLKILEDLIIKKNPDLLVFQWQSITESSTKIGLPMADDSLEGIWLACWNKCYKRTFINEKTFPENVLFEDTGYALDAYLSTHNRVFIEVPLYGHRHRSGGISRSKHDFSVRLGCLAGFESVLRNHPDNQRVKVIVVSTLLKHVWWSLGSGKFLTKNDIKVVKNFLKKYRLNEYPILFQLSRKRDRMLLGMFSLYAKLNL